MNNVFSLPLHTRSLLFWLLYPGSPAMFGEQPGGWIGRVRTGVVRPAGGGASRVSFRPDG